MKESEIIRRISEKCGISDLNEMQLAMAEKAKLQKILLLSPTGSGKTIAFATALFKNLLPPSGKVQAVVITPSRELTVQVGKVLQAISDGFKVTICYGGHDFEDERNSLSVVPDIVVGTPGRLLDHINRDDVELSSMRILVLDEFDKSLELGFSEEMRKIVRRMPNVSRRILTSATNMVDIPEFIRMENPEVLNFLSLNRTESRLHIYKVESPAKDKLETLYSLLCHVDCGKTIVFSNHRESAERIFGYLKEKNLPIGIYHGGLDQIEREKSVAMLDNGTFSILAATDLGARGLDLQGIENVIHYHIPLSAETYLHRNGRSARMDASGNVCVIVGPEERVPDFIKFDDELDVRDARPIKFERTTETLFFQAGKKEKISKGDVLGFLVSKGGLDAKKIGKITVADHYALAAIPIEESTAVLENIRHEKIKNKRIRISISKQM